MLGGDNGGGCLRIGGGTSAGARPLVLMTEEAVGLVGFKVVAKVAGGGRGILGVTGGTTEITAVGTGTTAGVKFKEAVVLGAEVELPEDCPAGFFFASGELEDGVEVTAGTELEEVSGKERFLPLG